jgi:MraZ protein
MIRFRGEHYNTLDSKGRTSIPARLRTIFTETLADERFFITKNFTIKIDGGETCRGLTIYPLAEFLAIEERFEQATGMTLADKNNYRRQIFAPAVECAMDKQGRVLIPPTLRDYAGLEKEIIFVGMQRKIELWDAATWNKVSAHAEMNSPEDNIILADIGI